MNFSYYSKLRDLWDVNKQEFLKKHNLTDSYIKSLLRKTLWKNTDLDIPEDVIETKRELLARRTF